MLPPSCLHGEPRRAADGLSGARRAFAVAALQTEPSLIARGDGLVPPNLGLEMVHHVHAEDAAQWNYPRN